MATSIHNNLPTNRAASHRPPDQKRTTHCFHQETNFVDIGATAITLNEYIALNGGTVYAGRSHVEITITHATAKLYIKRWIPNGLAATSAIYQWVISNASGFTNYVKIPLDGDQNLSIIADGASTTGLITECG